MVNPQIFVVAIIILLGSIGKRQRVGIWRNVIKGKNHCTHLSRLFTRDLMIMVDNPFNLMHLAVGEHIIRTSGLTNFYDKKLADFFLSNNPLPTRATGDSFVLHLHYKYDKGKMKDDVLPHNLLVRRSLSLSLSRKNSALPSPPPSPSPPPPPIHIYITSS
jgi:hypothetical protein